MLPLPTHNAARVVRRYFTGENPVGRRLVVGGRQLEIVGEVGRVKLASLDELNYRPHLYVPVNQYCPSNITFVARGLQRSSVSAADLRRAIWAVDPLQPILRIDQLQDLADKSASPQRILAVLVSLLAVLALLLSTMGAHAAVAFHTGQRTHEIAIRMALGATSRGIVAGVVRDAAAMIVAGLVIGLAAALAFARLMKNILFQVSPLDPVALTVACGSMMLVALVAAYRPARRAASVDPVETPRQEG